MFKNLMLALVGLILIVVGSFSVFEINDLREDVDHLDVEVAIVQDKLNTEVTNVEDILQEAESIQTELKRDMAKHELEYELKQRSLAMIAVRFTADYKIIVDGEPAEYGPWGDTYVVQKEGSMIWVEMETESGTEKIPVENLSPGEAVAVKFYNFAIIRYGMITDMSDDQFLPLIVDQRPQFQPLLDVRFEGIWSSSDRSMEASLARTGFTRLRQDKVIGYDVYLYHDDQEIPEMLNGPWKNRESFLLIEEISGGTDYSNVSVIYDKDWIAPALRVDCPEGCMQEHRLDWYEPALLVPETMGSPVIVVRAVPDAEGARMQYVRLSHEAVQHLTATLETQIYNQAQEMLIATE